MENKKKISDSTESGRFMSFSEFQTRRLNEGRRIVNEGLYEGDTVKDEDYDKLLEGIKSNINDKNNDQDFVKKGATGNSVLLTVSGVAGQKIADAKQGKVTFFLLLRNVIPSNLVAMGVDDPAKAKVSQFKVVDNEKYIKTLDEIYEAAVKAGLVKNTEGFYINAVW